MRQQSKNDTSPIIVNKWVYPENHTEIREVLAFEQSNLCAYTETYLGRTDKREIEHFNPTLKNSTNDSYHNWFLVKAQWNSEKSNKWAKFQPILHPTSADFLDRIIYEAGNYICHPTDIEAKNLINLLKLDDLELTKDRVRYIDRRRKEIAEKQISAETYFQELLTEEPNHVYFIRAIEEEFHITLTLKREIT